MYILFVDTEHQKQDAITHIAYSHTIRAPIVCCAVGRSHRSVGHIGRSVTSRTSSIAYGLSTLYSYRYIDTQYTTVVYYAIVFSTRILLSYSSTRTLDRLSTAHDTLLLVRPHPRPVIAAIRFDRGDSIPIRSRARSLSTTERRTRDDDDDGHGHG